MVPPRRAPRAATLAFGIAATVCLACGGASTVGGPTPLPVGDPEVLQVLSTNIDAWTQWKEGPGKFLERDFFDCFEINNVPRPSVTPVPDPSGHTRARRGCAEAIADLEKAIPDYANLAAVPSLVVPEGTQTFERYTSLVLARSERLQWAKDIVAAWKRQDMAALNELQGRVTRLSALETLALGLQPVRFQTRTP